MSTKILVKYFGPTGHSREMRETAYWRATAVCLTINAFEAAHPIPANVFSIEASRAAELLLSISGKLREYGVVRGPRWWQGGVGRWQRLEGNARIDAKMRFDGWDKGQKAWLMVLLEHDSAPSFEVRRQDYGLHD